MPELPEVETSRLGITPHIQKQKIAQIIVRNPKLRWPVPVAELEALAGQVIEKVERRGKYLKLICQTGYILIHLGMSGSLRILKGHQLQVSKKSSKRSSQSKSEHQPEHKSEYKPEKHDHIDLICENGAILRYNDPRRFGCYLFQKDNTQEHKLLAVLGPEPLSEDFTAAFFYQHSRGKKQSIKTFMMDSHIVVGVGNIYASESLFLAGIHPNASAGRVSLKRYEKLVIAIKQVLAAAIEQGGTTLKDFVGSDGKPGYFKQQLNVYGRESQPCVACSSTIKKIKQGQRSTFYCPKCQK